MLLGFVRRSMLLKSLERSGSRLRMLHTGRIIALTVIITITVALHIYIRFYYGISDWNFLRSLAVILPLGWFLGKRYDSLKHLSEKDVLTDIYNRRFIQDLFPRLSNAMNKKANRMIVLLIDVDNFKSINDTYSHEAGDNVLRGISTLLTRLTRKRDLVARWGGDEFLVILPYLDQLRAEQLKQLLNKELRVGKLHSQFAVPISVSVGHAVYPDEGSSLGELLEVADKRMYQQKFEVK